MSTFYSFSNTKEGTIMNVNLTRNWTKKKTLDESFREIIIDHLVRFRLIRETNFEFQHKEVTLT